MKWTPAPQGESNAPRWLKSFLTGAYRSLCGLLMLGALVLVGAYLFHIPIDVSAIHLAQLFSLGFGLLSVTAAWRIWVLRSPVPLRFGAPVSYGYPGWRAFLQSQLAAGFVLVLFAALLSFL